ncbi:MAG: hypothetical protein IT445_05535 [Phycisphaeraceae bacterium]|nr:hypothetical protein [Phycisphaeraceae bacterium]
MSSGLVRMICPNLSCRKVLSVPQSARGKSVRCRHCGMRIQVPAMPSMSPGSEISEPPQQAATETGKNG